MKVIVTPVCEHRNEDGTLGYHSSGEPFTGRALSVDAEGVYVDGKPVIRRDRRAKAEREPGHGWWTSNHNPDPRFRRMQWTGFRIEVQP